MKKLYFLTALFVLSCIQLNAQQTPNDLVKFKGEVIRCYTVEATEQLEKQDPIYRKSNETFEEWLKPLVEEAKLSKKDDEVMVIPVVIHVVHNGDPINTPGNRVGENISYAQAVSQINVLNQDFRRLAGTPGAENTGYELGVDTRIEFKLATIAPDGTATNGVNRVNLNKESWTMQEVNSQVKPETIWDPTRYFNMWSVRFGGSSSNLLGYAQFPSQSGLDGMPSNGGSASTDGVVANYATFGTIAEDDGSFLLSAPYNKGRTMTHEVGHWVGLRHIWGDGDCSVDDFCEDTPNADGPTSGCPVGQESCGSIDMIENYMDYSYDACMNTYTEDQRLRMVAVMENSPRRKELLESNAFDTSDYELDAKITLNSVTETGASPCDTVAEINPVVVLESTGPNPITSATIAYGIPGLATMTYEWTGELNQFEYTTINLPAIADGLVTGVNEVTAQIVFVNGMDDDFQDNNVSTGTYVLPEMDIPTFNENNFIISITPDNYGSETTWNIRNQNNEIVASGGPYTDGDSETVTEEITLDPDSCYYFTIFDGFGDGMCCSYGNGSYEVTTANGEVVATGGTFTDEESTPFTIGQLATNEFNTKEFSINPNPSNGILRISHDFVNAKFALNVYDLSGKLVARRTQSDKTVDLSNLKPGVYIIEIKDGKETFSDKIIIK
ncbi:T9SS type A sorting domain-containing protein [Flavobacteriaceae bacterium Ap0902]|nr:T9SS type A sorting domain-containing protein [Flavobacteriaceae bacterium Ap0902]